MRGHDEERICFLAFGGARSERRKGRVGALMCIVTCFLVLVTGWDMYEVMDRDMRVRIWTRRGGGGKSYVMWCMLYFM